MFNIWGSELLILMILAVIILGPTKLPEYATKLRDATIRVRDLAKGASSQLRDEMGPAFDDVDWKQLDPRQYDPRRIVREALESPSGMALDGASADVPVPTARRTGTVGQPRPARGRVPTIDPGLPTPFDHDAT